MNNTTQKFLDNVRDNLETFRVARGLERFELAELIGISPQLLSEFLNGSKSLSLENLLKADSIMQLGTPMTQQTPDEGLDLVNQSVLARYAKSGSRIAHFTSALQDGDGFVPNENGSDLNGAESGNIADVLTIIASNKNNGTLARQLRALVEGLKRSSSETVEKAKVNRSGVTREPVSVVGGSNGQRATWVDGTSFDRNGGVLKVNEKTMEFARQDLRKEQKEAIQKSHEAKNCGMHFTGDTLNTDHTVNLEKVGKLHELSLIADRATYDANMRRIEANKLREWRAANGQATLDDLVGKYNSLKA